jgi:hypothetical protein
VNVWRLLHIACMFGAVATIAGTGLVRNVVLHSGDVRVVREALRVERRLGNTVGGPLLVAGVAFGFLTAVTMGFDLLSPWLVIAYALLVANLFNGAVLYERHARKLEAAAEAAAEAASSGELTALIASRRTWTLNLVDLLLWGGLVFTMVVKPFS